MAEEWTKEQIIARIRAEAIQQGVDPDLAVAVATQESYLNPNARGDNGKSLGLFQLQPAAATDAGIAPALRHVPALNIQGGVRYLKLKLDQSKGNVDQALSRYNRGTPDYRGIGDPNYVQNVKKFYKPGGEAEQPRPLMARQTTEDKPWWQRALGALGPRSAEAAAPQKKWYDDALPEKPPMATAPTQPSPSAASSPQEGAPAGKWYDVLPEKPPVSPLPASPGAPAQAPLSGEPPAASVAPAPTWKVGLGDPEGTATEAEAQGAVEQLRQRQAPPPAASGAPAPPQAAPALPGPATTVTPESQALAQQIEPISTDVDPDELSKRWDEGGATSTDPAWWSGADPASPRHQEWLKTSPMPPLRDVAREVAATGVEGAYGVLGTAAGGAVGGVPGAVAGGIAGQSLGRRVTNATGLREQEPYLATGFGLNLYPSDVANAGFGLLTGGPALFKAALAKTTAGKAIVEAEMTTKQAYQAWQIERQRLQAAQKTGQQAELNTALKDHATAEANYKRLVKERNDTIDANKAEYDQAVKDYGEGARQTHIEDLTAQQKYLDDLAEAQRKQYGAARADTERELLASREKGYTKTLDQIKKEQGDYEGKLAEEQTMRESQAAAIPEARAIPEPYAQGTPSHVLYKDMREKYSNEPLTLTQGQADLKDLRANRPKTLAGTPSPFEGEVETIAQGLEKATGANVATIHEQLKKLGPLTRHKEGKIRGDAKQLTSILMDVLETAPEAAGAIKVANTRFKREMALEDINDWLKPGHGVISSRRGVDTIKPDALLNKFNKELGDSKLFRDSFTPEEVATMQDNMRALAAKTLPPPGPRGPVPS